MGLPETGFCHTFFDSFILLKQPHRWGKRIRVSSFISFIIHICGRQQNKNFTVCICRRRTSFQLLHSAANRKPEAIHHSHHIQRASFSPSQIPIHLFSALLLLSLFQQLYYTTATTFLLLGWLLRVLRFLILLLKIPAAAAAASAF